MTRTRGEAAVSTSGRYSSNDPTNHEVALNPPDTPQDLVRAYRGRLIKNGANGLLAMFDAPGQAIRCASAVVADAAAAGIQIRVGIHTGELDLVDEGIAGDSVRITEGVATLGRPAEILVSRTVKDLVAGTGVTFAERGSHVPNGPPEERKTRWSGVPNSSLSSNPAGGGPAASTPTFTTPLASHSAVSVRTGPVSLVSTARAGLLPRFGRAHWRGTVRPDISSSAVRRGGCR
jgi:hypothetical protein